MRNLKIKLAFKKNKPLILEKQLTNSEKIAKLKKVKNSPQNLF